jgi:hypothetical protein
MTLALVTPTSVQLADGGGEVLRALELLALEPPELELPTLDFPPLPPFADVPVAGEPPLPPVGVLQLGGEAHPAMASTASADDKGKDHFIRASSGRVKVQPIKAAMSGIPAL